MCFYRGASFYEKHSHVSLNVELEMIHGRAINFIVLWDVCPIRWKIWQCSNQCVDQPMARNN